MAYSAQKRVKNGSKTKLGKYFSKKPKLKKVLWMKVKNKLSNKEYIKRNFKFGNKKCKKIHLQNK